LFHRQIDGRREVQRMKVSVWGIRQRPYTTALRPKGVTVMGAIAVVLFAIAFFIHGSGTATNVWFDPTSLMYAGLCCLALHLLGVGTGWYSHRR
jgi:hypothetical protein